MVRRLLESFFDTLRRGDVFLLVICLMASVYGTVMISSAAGYMGATRYVLVQVAATCIGVALYLFLSSLDLLDVTKKGWKWLLAFSVGIILLLVTPFGVADNTGNRAWLDFPFLPVNIQPSELVKVTYILLLAKQLDYLKKEREDLKSIPSVAFLVGLLGLSCGAYYEISSDMGSVLAFLAIFAGVCVVAGVAKRWVFIGGFVAGFTFFILWMEEKIPPYMMDRFKVLFDHSYDPLDTGWQQTRSLLALGGGKMLGQGLYNGIQTQSENSWALPFRHTDFIFAVIGEELGFLGCMAALLLLGIIIVKCILVARQARSQQERLICVGVAMMLLFQVVANVGMCLFVMPVIGLTLPFFSYGGSSTVALYAAMGIVSSVHGHSQQDWLK